MPAQEDADMLVDRFHTYTEKYSNAKTCAKLHLDEVITVLTDLQDKVDEEEYPEIRDIIRLTIRKHEGIISEVKKLPEL